MNATERMRAQADALRAMLAGTEAGKAMGGPGAPPPVPPGAPGVQAPPGAGQEEEPDGDEGQGGPGDGDGDEGMPPEAGKTLDLPQGTEAVTLIDGDQFMGAFKAMIVEVVKAEVAAGLAPVYKALDNVADATALQMAGLGEVGKAVGALRLAPAAAPGRAGVAAPNARPGSTAGANAVGARIDGRPPVDALTSLDERLKGLNESGRERVLMPLVFQGKMDMHVAQEIVNRGALPRDMAINAEAVKAALDADAR